MFVRGFEIARWVCTLSMLQNVEEYGFEPQNHLFFVSSQKLSCRHKPIYNSNLTDPSFSSGSPHSREMADTEAGLN